MDLDRISTHLEHIEIRPEHVSRLAQELSLKDREHLIAEILSNLPAEAKSRIIDKQLGQSGLAIVMGGNGSMSTDLCVQIQNAPNVNIAAIIEAAVARRRKEREK
jgi:hypothetical protein